jgi:hypothetical protein
MGVLLCLSFFVRAFQIFGNRVQFGRRSAFADLWLVFVVIRINKLLLRDLAPDC